MTRGAFAMSCWVVPTIAADLWGCTVEHVWAAIRDGQIATREENGWLFVDAAPGNSAIELPRPLRPATFTPVSQAESVALLSGDEECGADGAEVDDADQLPLGEDPHTPLGDWRTVREQTSRLRRPPGVSRDADSIE